MLIHIAYVVKHNEKVGKLVFSQQRYLRKPEDQL